MFVTKNVLAGQPQGKILGCYFLAWFLVFLLVVKGITVTGKVGSNIIVGISFANLNPIPFTAGHVPDRRSPDTDNPRVGHPRCHTRRRRRRNQVFPGA